MLDADGTAWREALERVFRARAEQDASHDLHHARRVKHMALRIADADAPGVDRLVLLAGAYLHDLVNPPVDSPDRPHASRLAAEAARPILAGLGMDSARIEAVAHAIEAHSFSAGIAPLTDEARILQDADRLEALGAIGLARTFWIAGRLGSALFDPDDLEARDRPLDDKRFALDHLPRKLYRIVETLHMPTARRIGAERVAFLRGFVARLAAELEGG
jgi:uncharacterized protein